MNVDMFFEKFERLADAPNAIAKVRELVLELAVQGKLIEPSPKPDSHPAWLAFKKEISERAYGYDPGPPQPFEIPAHWEWCVLTEVADCRASAKVSPTSIADADWVLDLEDIDGTTGQIVQFATFAERRSLSTKAAFEPGDVLYGKLRPYLNKVVVAPKSGFCTTEIIPLRPAAFLTPEFLRFYLRSQTFLRYAAQKNYGMKMPRLGTKDLESAEIPVPPPAEQKRIVAKVEELMALCDRLEAQQQERDTRHAALARASLARFADAPTPANLHFLFHPSYTITPADLRKSILTLAVQGKLVPQDSNDEPAEELLRRVDAEREKLVKSKKIRCQEFLGPVADEAIPFDIPASWQWRYLADVCFLITDGAHHTPQYLESGVPFLSVKDVSSGTIDFSSTRFISEEAHRELCKRCPPELGDILLTKVGTTGIAVTVDEDREFSIFVSLALLKFSQPNIDRHYLKHLINSPFVRQQSADNTQGVGNKNLVLRLINRFTVPIPPLAEQRRIVAKVDQLMALVYQLETQLATSRATSEKLMEAVVAELTAS